MKNFLVYNCCLTARRGLQFELEKMEDSRVNSRKDYRGHFIINCKKYSILEESLDKAMNFYNKFKFVYVTIIINDKKDIDKIKDLIVFKLKGE